MLYKEIFLEDHFAGLPHLSGKTKLCLYMQSPSKEIIPDAKYPCVLICPGGGYSFTSEREAEPIALRFLGQGINAAVVWYNCAPQGAVWPDELLEAASAMAYLRRNAEELHCDPARIAVMGFSAGGHLACSLGEYHILPEIHERLTVSESEIRPDGMILCYSVVSSGEKAHRGSFDCLLGDDKDDSQALSRMSLEKHVTAATPKAFIWHTFSDNAVPVENSMMLAQALREKDIPFELHIYPEGGHGLSLCDASTASQGRADQIDSYVGEWFSSCVSWVKRYL